MSGYHLFHFFMGAVAAIFALIPYVLVMQILMPRAVLEHYWKEPHFRPAELALFTGVFAPLRTFMFMWAIAFPGFGKKRNIAAAYRFVPVWYRVLSIMFSLWFLAAGTLMTTILAGFSMYDFLQQA